MRSKWVICETVRAGLALEEAFDALPHAARVMCIRRICAGWLATSKRQRVEWLLRYFRWIRDSIRDRGDVTVKTGANLAETRKSQVTFTSLNSTEITPVYSTPAGEIFLAPA